MGAFIIARLHRFPLLTLHSSWMVQLPEPFGFIFTWFAALPLILFLAQSLTKAIVQDFLILKVVFFRSIYYYSLWHIYCARWKIDEFYGHLYRGLVRIVALKIFPSSGLYCRSLAVVQQTT